MGLSTYKKKRNFDVTPEPLGGAAKKDELLFVIQKHHASRLHYDFRIEAGGVLKSWAVPKGPSLNPKDKRLAMLVEDHPFDYKDFEGVIPEGNYGAGTVIIWDHGRYAVKSDKTLSKKQQEKKLSEDFKKGSIKITLYGEKVKGEFALVKLKGKDENTWLLIKHRDEFASEEDVTTLDKSVVSGSTLEDIKGDTKAKHWKGNSETLLSEDEHQSTTNRKASKRRKDKTSTTAVREWLAPLKSKKKSAMPEDVTPMLATLTEKPFHEKGWIYEIKWDGYRAISYINKGVVEIRSRNNKDFNKKFYPVFSALESLPFNAVVDGEIIVINHEGKPDFNALQQWRSEADGQLIYYVFDLLWLEGYDLMQVPLNERKSVLEKLVPKDGMIRLSENVEAHGEEVYRQAEKMNLEGIVAKHKDSSYTPSVRSKQWLKIKTEKHQEVVIGGYTRNENTSKKFSALLLGIFDKGRFVSLGAVGTGFTDKLQKEILEKLKPHITDKCPFEVPPEYNKPSRFRPNPPRAEVTWVKPHVVAEISYRALTDDGSLRHPSFRGLREDKEAKEVVREHALTSVSVVNDKAEGIKVVKPAKKSGRKTLLNPTDETQVRNLEGHDVKFTNLSKVFWPEEGYTKRDMLNYYYQVIPLMLPYVKDRPQTLNRFPNGIYGKSFYQKDVTGKVPSWIETYAYYSEGDQREKHFLVCTDEASLLYIASLGCIEINPWSSRIQTPDHPDWCIIDLDPGASTTFEQVIETAQVTKEVLDAIGVPSYCKTSGSTGLHLYIPLGAKYTYEDSKEFGRAVVKVVNKHLPVFTSIERKVNDRKGKLYLDFLQNRPQATVAGPYSLRPKPGAPVSMPLHWSEVKKGLKITDFTLSNAMARLSKEGDLFSGVLGEGIDISAAMNNLLRIFGRM